MDYWISAHSDIGIRKKTNQDSCLLQVAMTDEGKVVFGVVCDGMGGLAKGEVASATLIREFALWFTERFKAMLEEGFEEEKLYDQWGKIVEETNRRIGIYGARHEIRLGTTLTAILIFKGKYYCVNVGDSRTYQIRERVVQITKDHSYVQREIDGGRMTIEEAIVNPHRNVLTQCVGASDVVVPEFFTGDVEPQDVYMLCSDGFRHVLTNDEIFEKLNSRVLTSEKVMQENSEFLTELDKKRQEDDNISVLLIKVV